MTRDELNGLVGSWRTAGGKPDAVGASPLKLEMKGRYWHG
jgi:hypothetical protein